MKKQPSANLFKKKEPKIAKKSPEYSQRAGEKYLRENLIRTEPKADPIKGRIIAKKMRPVE